MTRLWLIASVGVTVALMGGRTPAASVQTAPRADERPIAIPDPEFWRLVTELSEPSGIFPQQLMSNEDSAQFVVPALEQSVRRGGVYIGVGAEQNFTYLAALRPRLAFIVDIRRDNMLQLLLYKALFELSPDRAAFVSGLFSRRRPGGLNASTNVAALFAAFEVSPPDAALFAATSRMVLDTLTRVHGFALGEAERSAITRMLEAFRTAGPNALTGYGDGMRLTYAQLMAATDLAGREHSFLSSEDRYAFVRTLERQNLIVPVVGDFAGGTALTGIGRYLKDRNTVVDVFYASNVERYLWEQGGHGRQFYTNMAALPLDASSTFIRSLTTDISQRLGIVVPAGSARWRTFLSPIRDCLDRIADGRIQAYRDLFGYASGR